MINKIIKFSKRNIVQNVALSLFSKSISLGVSFLSVPIMLSYLGNDVYGVWLTIFSVISWMSFFDLGLGNGMRNYLTKSFVNNNYKKAQEYVSTGYFSLSVIVIVILILLQLSFFFIDWNIIFNLKNKLDINLTTVMSVCLWGGGILLISRLIISVLQSQKKTGIGNLFMSLGGVMSLLILYSIRNIEYDDKLIKIAYIFSWSSPIVLIAYSFYYFYIKERTLKPLFKKINKSLFKDIFGLGMSFFIAQFLVLFLNQSSNIIITQLLSPSDVAIYYIPLRLFSVISIMMGMVSVNLLPYFTEAHAKNDMNAIKRFIKYFILFYLIVVILGIAFYLFSEQIIAFWTNNQIVVPKSLIFYHLILVLLTGINTIFATMYNGFGEIKVQLPFLLMSVIIFLGLSLFLGEKIGLNGIVLGTIFSQLPMTLFLIIGTYKKLYYKKH